MNKTTVTLGDLGAVVSGIFDVIFAFTIALERKRVLERGEIVDVLKQVAAQEAAPTARAALADLMLKAFDTPVAGDQARARLRLVLGTPD
jgi:hypothetical protein